MKKRSRRGAGKAGKGVQFIPAVSWEFGLPGTRFDYAREVRDGLMSSVIVSVLNWKMRAFPEAPVIVERRESDQWREVSDHPIANLIRFPNPYYGGRVLLMATAMDFSFGEAFWLKVRNGFGRVVELWWIPRGLIRPMWDDNRAPGKFITHYEYTIAGRKQDLPVEDVVHFRFGQDPINPRRGFTPLTAVLREVYVDDQASNFTASILRNLGIIGIVFSPGAGSSIPGGKLEDFKKYIQENFTGDKRGQAMAFSNPTDAKVLSYNLQGLDMGPIRDIAEERVSAATGIPAAVVGFGTGLQQTKVGATMREMIQLAWKGAIMPEQEILADEMDRSLLPDFQGNPSLFRIKFDASQVRALWEDEQQKSDRVIKLVGGGVITLGEGRRELGFEVKPEHEVYYRPQNVAAVSTPDEKVEPKALPAPRPEPPQGEQNVAA